MAWLSRRTLLYSRLFSRSVGQQIYPCFHLLQRSHTNAQPCSVCLVSILRLQSLVAISNSADPSYDNPPAATWSSVESNVGIICACLPLLRPLITKWLPRAFPSRHRSIYSHSRPQNRTYGSRGGSKALRTKDDYVLDVTKRSNGSSEEGRDIQVVTDIHVEVDGADGRRISGWRTPASQNNWSDNVSSKETQRENSTESLVNQHVRVSSR